MTTNALYIGIMSGTSLDGIDTVLVEIDNNQVRLLDSYDHPIPDSLKQRILDVSLGQQTSLPEIGQIDHLLGKLYAQAVHALLDKSGYKASDITAIGNHGQTVFHQPTGQTPFTLQLGDANIIAALTRIDTVADFRRKDIALGGQGAPLVPAFHQSIFQPQSSTVVVLNIGGIANISVLRPNQAVIGYDTGPGNMLMDAWCFRHEGAAFDKDAKFASKGNLNQPLLCELLKEPYLALSAPKSTGRELFNIPWLEAIVKRYSASSADVQRTLCEYTAQTIANEVAQFKLGQEPELLVCGGGAHNPLLMQRLKDLLPEWQVMPTDDKGVDSNNMEAMAFAWLAYRRIHNLPSNLPEVTGASQLASLGVLYLADK
ncbi:anhydro-N-acetylmuramic acid kinase [Vibrio sp. JPW-9-11-11]|uniref:anhydro-N-acetylmuramic acid kinase n=1 Tax=Vibrio sp. JPW-9-11-11 TaxID=1416532 RepID=UPI0015932472|nr:anhydro-N-acetylmuramic acid kinase [Vibrio sp. JPW-9-11-11]NVD05779.1 anhydro-N-acetylmuramic acid kinase [Vibrio sp. JPW-9-11-11]